MVLIGNQSQSGFIDERDPYIASLPLMESPLPWLCAIVGQLIICKVLFAKFSHRSNNYLVDKCRPLMLVTNGLQFGSYVSGLFIMFVCSNYLRDCFDCDTYQQHTDLNQLTKQWILKTLAYLLIWFKLFDFNRLTFSAMATKQEDYSWMRIARHSSIVMITWLLVSASPGGVMIMNALIELLSESIHYGYLILSLGSYDIRPSRSTRNKIFALRCLMLTANLIHSFVFFNCGYRFLNTLVVIYTIIELSLYPFDFFRRKSIRLMSNRKNFEQD